MFYKKFKGKCAECGKDIFLDSPDEISFCDRTCETNHKWKKNSFGSTERKNKWDKLKIKK